MARRLFMRPILVAVVLTSTGMALAQSAPGTLVSAIAAANFTPEGSRAAYGWDAASEARYSMSGPELDSTTRLATSLILPSGALLDKIVVEVYDDDPGVDVSAELVSCSSPNSSCTPVVAQVTTGQPGWTNLNLYPVVLAIDNENTFYLLRVILQTSSPQNLTMFRKAVLYYRLQPSPAPATSTFLDVPTTSPYFQFVEALTAAGITAGCGGGNYCPDAPVTRGQMAVFLAKALGIYWPAS